MESFITNLPKLELHLHIEGTLTPERRLSIAKRNNLTLPPNLSTAEQIRQSYMFDSLASFLVCYYLGIDVLLTKQDFYDLAWDYLEKSASQNVRYVEIFFDPQAHTGRGVAFETILQGLVAAIADAKKTLNIQAKLILCFLRDHEAGWAMDTLVQSLPYKEHIIGIGLDSDERDNPPEKFLNVYKRAKEEGYRLTMHCDIDQHESIKNIETAIKTIGVERVDHGINLVENPTLMAHLSRLNIGLTVCPISNSYVTGNLCEDRIRTLLDAGVKVTINSDDPAYMGGQYVSENLTKLQQSMQLTKQEMVRLQLNAVDICWAEEVVKEGLRRQLNDHLINNT